MTRALAPLDHPLLQLCAAVKAIEAELEAGQLTEAQLTAQLGPRSALEPPDAVARIHRAYLARLQDPPSYAALTRPLRASILHHTLEATWQALRPPTKTFPATLTDPDRPRWGLIAEGPAGPIPLRFDQAVTAWRWGVGFELPDERRQALLDTLVGHLESALAGAVRDLDLIEAHLGPRGRLLRPVSAPTTGHRVEQILLDVLNEDQPSARHASLYEDFVERTDARIRGYGRRGGRLQITLMASPQDKKKQGKLPTHQIVVLSPWALATRIFSGETEAPDAFWRGLPQRPTTAQGLARVLQHTWMGALDRATEDPRGPLAALPPASRALIRADVHGALKRMGPRTHRRRKRI